jgi:hypothetical protein
MRGETMDRDVMKIIIGILLLSLFVVSGSVFAIEAADVKLKRICSEIATQHSGYYEQVVSYRGKWLCYATFDDGITYQLLGEIEVE